MTLEISTLNVIISGFLSAASAWLLASNRTQQTRITNTNNALNKLALDNKELEGRINVEIAKREGLRNDITRVEEMLGEVNDKLDQLILRK